MMRATRPGQAPIADKAQQPNDAFLEAANRIGARLCRDAIWNGRRCNWLGDSMEVVGGSWTVVHRAFGPDLYGGTSGIALFLTRLFSLTNERVYRLTAEGALQQALSRLNDIPPPAHMGFYAGWLGVAYSLATASQVFQQRSLADRALDIVRSAAKEEMAEHGLDVIGGSAGAIPALLALYRQHPRDFLLDLAIRHGDHLLETARKSEFGWSWDTAGLPGQRDLLGFSHGTAGIGWALLELARQTEQERFRQAAEAAFAYERHWFSPEHQNWPDFRSSYDPALTDSTNGALSFMVAWCHGAPGVGLSRLRAYELSGDEAYLAEAKVAIGTTASTLGQPGYGGLGNFSLCHGLAGNAELLLYASQVLGDAGLKQHAEQVGWQGIEQFENPNLAWPCGVMGGGETPNLMLGLAGIGHFYLRLYDPARTPSIMLITPQEERSLTRSTDG